MICCVLFFINIIVFCCVRVCMGKKGVEGLSSLKLFLFFGGDLPILLT
jgi:hypothetical protein